MTDDSDRKRKRPMIVSDDEDEEDDVEKQPADDALGPAKRSSAKRSKIEETSSNDDASGYTSFRRPRVSRSAHSRRTGCLSGSNVPTSGMNTPAPRTAALDLLVPGVYEETDVSAEAQEDSGEYDLPEFRRPIEEQGPSNEEAGDFNEAGVHEAPAEPSVQGLTSEVHEDENVDLAPVYEPTATDAIDTANADVDAPSEADGDDSVSVSVSPTDAGICLLPTDETIPVSTAGDATSYLPSDLETLAASLPAPTTVLAYCGSDWKYVRFRNPPTSYLAPNPVRRAPILSDFKRDYKRDNYRYLPRAVQQAALQTYNETWLVSFHPCSFLPHCPYTVHLRREFPAWMQNPSRSCVANDEYIPGGNLVPTYKMHPMQTEEVSIVMDFNFNASSVGHIDLGASSSTASLTVEPTRVTSDLYLLPPPELFPSEASYASPHIELDPDLDVTSLESQSRFRSHGTTGDFLVANHSYASDTSTSQCSDEYWSPQDVMLQTEHTSMSVPEPFAGPSGNRHQEDVAEQPYITPTSSGSTEQRVDEAVWDSAQWLDSPQFALFGSQLSTPIPAQNMSTESSLDGMLSYSMHCVSYSSPPVESSVDDTPTEPDEADEADEDPDAASPPHQSPPSPSS